MKNEYIQLVPSDESFAEQAAAFYQRNRRFLEVYEPARSETFFLADYQRKVLKKEMFERKEKTAFHFYLQHAGFPQKIIGMAGLNNVVWGAFCSAFLGYKMDEEYTNKGYMSMAVDMLVKYAFEELCLHRIEANVMPRNTASIRVLEKNHFVNEGISRYYLKINGVWEDHIHMVRINYDMH